MAEGGNADRFGAGAARGTVAFHKVGSEVHGANITTSVLLAQLPIFREWEYTNPGRDATMRRMLTVEEIRHHNVRRLIAEIEAKMGKVGPRSGAQTVFAGRINKSTTYVNQVAAKRPFKTIGSAVAREIEESLQLERGWLDNLHDSESQPLRLDPDMLAETAKALRERGEAEGRRFSMEADPERFIRAYRMREELTGTKDASNVLALALRFADSERGLGGDRREHGVPAEGTHGRRMGEGGKKA